MANLTPRRSLSKTARHTATAISSARQPALTATAGDLRVKPLPPSEASALASDGRRRLRAHVNSACFHIVLIEPEIPPNTGAVARTCAATGAVLHLVGPMGFEVSDRSVRRAGLDYWHLVDVRTYENSASFLSQAPVSRLRLFTTESERNLFATQDKPPLSPGDYLVFGKESTGLDPSWAARFPDQTVSIPMPGAIRSLNLSNAVAIALYEGLRQTGALASAFLG